MLSPIEKASELLTQHGGVQREAETAAWQERERYGGPESDGYKFFSEVAVAIAFGREYPPVERKTSKYAETPAPAFTGTAK